MSVTINGTSGLVFNDASTQTTAATGFGFKNRIINGDMRIDQRNAGASVTPTVTGGTNTYIVDRWAAAMTQASKFSAQRNAGSVTPPAGFTNYLGMTSLSAYSVVASDYFVMAQLIEGFNIADFGWGTANAQTVTVSFWVRSSLTGTFSGSLTNDGSLSYVFNYTISQANTWTAVSVTIPGPTSGSWNTTNGIGVYVRFGLGCGSTFTTSTVGSWVASNSVQSTGSVGIVGTNGATFYITGVQLEKGSTATSFDYRPYSTELQLAQRYYYRTSPGALTKILTTGGNCESTVSMYGAAAFPVPMRVSPSALEQTGTASDYLVFHSATSSACSAVPAYNAATTNNIYVVNGTVASGLTANRPANLATNSTSAYLGWSAEL